MPELNVRDVISPLAYQLFLFFGYFVFAFAWIVISYAVMKGLLDLVEFVEARRPLAAKAARRDLARDPLAQFGDKRSRKVILFPSRVKSVGIR